MLKWTATRNNRLMFGLGLEPKNIQMLQEYRPIWAKGAEVNIPMDVCIHYGETKEAMIAEMKSAGIDLPPVQKWTGNEHVDFGLLIRAQERSEEQSVAVSDLRAEVELRARVGEGNMILRVATARRILDILDGRK